MLMHIVPHSSCRILSLNKLNFHWHKMYLCKRKIAYYSLSCLHGGHVFCADMSVEPGNMMIYWYLDQLHHSTFFRNVVSNVIMINNSGSSCFMLIFCTVNVYTEQIKKKIHTHPLDILTSQLIFPVLIYCNKYIRMGFCIQVGNKVFGCPQN